MFFSKGLERSFFFLIKLSNPVFRSLLWPFDAKSERKIYINILNIFFLFFATLPILLINLHCCPALFPVGKNINVSPHTGGRRPSTALCWWEISRLVSQAFLFYLSIFKERKSWKWHLLMDLSHTCVFLFLLFCEVRFTIKGYFFGSENIFSTRRFSWKMWLFRV